MQSAYTWPQDQAFYITSFTVMFHFLSGAIVSREFRLFKGQVVACQTTQRAKAKRFLLS